MQECYLKVTDILFELYHTWQVRLDATVSQLSGVCNSLMAAGEQLEPHSGPSGTRHLQRGSLISSGASISSMGSTDC